MPLQLSCCRFLAPAFSSAPASLCLHFLAVLVAVSCSIDAQQALLPSGCEAVSTCITWLHVQSQSGWHSYGSPCSFLQLCIHVGLQRIWCAVLLSLLGLITGHASDSYIHMCDF